MGVEFVGIIERTISSALEGMGVKDVLSYIQSLCDGIDVKPLRDKETLTTFLKEHCHLSNFELLKSLVDALKLESSKQELTELTKKRDEFYKTTLAKDFATEGIEDHKTTANHREVCDHHLSC